MFVLFLFLGPTKRAINKVLYAMILISFLTMQIYVEWQKSLMEDNNTLNSIAQKTGLVTSLAVFMIAANFVNNVFFPKSKTNSQEYFLLEDFVNILVICVIIPLIVIWRNPTMKKYAIAWILSSKGFRLMVHVHFSVINKIRILRNKVQPMLPK